MPEKEVKAVAEALQSRFREALNAGRLSQVCLSFLVLWLGLVIWSSHNIISKSVVLTDSSFYLFLL